MRNTHNLCEGVAPLELCVITTPTRTSLHLSILHLFIPKSRRLDVSNSHNQGVKTTLEELGLRNSMVSV